MPEDRLPWRRHDLLRVPPSAWARIVPPSPRFASVPYVARWAERGWPLIVRRRARGDDPGLIPAAFPLPPDVGKLRVGVQVAEGDVLGRLPPVTLRAAREDAPPLWRETVGGLLRIAEQAGVEPLVFGSLLWQRLTGLAYLSPTSDLDLLWPAHDQDTAGQLTRCLADLEKTSPVRFDGEILLPDGGGVQWRELHDRPAEVLVKTTDGVGLRAVASLFSARIPAT